MIELWDYLHGVDRNEMQLWAEREKLGVRERAQLNQKLDMLAVIGFDTAWQLKFVAGTSGNYNHIYKLIVKSQRMLRPMLCRGPRDMRAEITLLCGAIEKDFELHPAGAASQPDKYRLQLETDLKLGHNRRVEHERF